MCQVIIQDAICICSTSGRCKLGQLGACDFAGAVRHRVEGKTSFERHPCEKALLEPGSLGEGGVNVKCDDYVEEFRLLEAGPCEHCKEVCGA